MYKMFLECRYISLHCIYSIYNSTYLFLTVIPNTTETYCHRHGNGCHEEADLTMPPHLGGKNVTDVSICCCDQDL